MRQVSGDGQPRRVEQLKNNHPGVWHPGLEEPVTHWGGHFRKAAQGGNLSWRKDVVKEQGQGKRSHHHGKGRGGRERRWL